MFNGKKMNLLVLILAIVVLTISVAYAALQTTLSISGTAGIQNTTWDIHFTNVSDVTPSGNNTGQIVSVTANATSIENLKAELKKPGDYISYDFDIKNFGTIDAKLSSFTKTITCQTGSNCNHATYTITCLDSLNSAVTEGFVLTPNSSISCNLYLKYKDDANISDDIGATISADWVFEQN